MEFGNELREVSCFIIAAARPMAASASPSPPIWTAGPILHAVQTANIFTDCKDFVDAPLLTSPDEAWKRWDALAQPPSHAVLAAFVNATFGPPGGELAAWSPPDFEERPPLLAKLTNPAAHAWAAKLNELSLIHI